MREGAFQWFNKLHFIKLEDFIKKKKKKVKIETAAVLRPHLGC